MTPWLFALLIAPQLAAIKPADSAQVLDSGERKVHLLELFTSEGCSSCPPADRWLQGHLEDPALWTEVVPLAFHVDYWDYLGWRDPFAHPEHTARQRHYAQQGHTSGVYTPGFFVDGREWRGFFQRRQLTLDRPAAPRLRSTINQGTVAVELDTTNLQQPVVSVAILGFGLQTQVPRGENRGRRLAHDFVVLGMQSQPLTLTDIGYQATVKLPDSRRPTGRQALAIWVSDDSQQTVQAVGGWLNPVTQSPP